MLVKPECLAIRSNLVQAKAKSREKHYYGSDRGTHTTNKQLSMQTQFFTKVRVTHVKCSRKQQKDLPQKITEVFASPGTFGSMGGFLLIMTTIISTLLTMITGNLRNCMYSVCATRSYQATSHGIQMHLQYYQAYNFSFIVSLAPILIIFTRQVT